MEPRQFRGLGSQAGVICDDGVLQALKTERPRGLITQVPSAFKNHEKKVGVLFTEYIQNIGNPFQHKIILRDLK